MRDAMPDREPKIAGSNVSEGPATQGAGESAGNSLKRDMPLVPAASIAGRALVTVIAIMTFLASLAAGVALLIAGASDGWRNSIAREMTVQLRPIPGRDLDADAKTAAGLVRAVPGVADVRVFTKD